jgi:rhamnose utilization protein RhaD (predicted bifunctional aldolase and dehydrogenase)/NAD(P)-dependent dehydrogenase (short-subunit alcohol dehydrogenase family)
MQSLWDDAEAGRYRGDLGLRVYSSRLLGRDRSLVLHGGGNTSVKILQPDLFGETEEVLYVKGSGWDLETIEESGFAPVRLAPVRRLAELPALSDPQMMNELATHTLRAGAPPPSVEAILHAVLPQRYVDHTHADAVVTVTNTPGGAERVRKIYGDSVIVIPYVMPGFELARAVFERLAAEGTLAAKGARAAQGAPAAKGAPATAGRPIGMVLLQHGIFSFGDTARESYERMIHLVGLAEDYLRERRAWVLDRDTPAERRPAAAAGDRVEAERQEGQERPAEPEGSKGQQTPAEPEDPEGRGPRALAIAALRRELSAAAGRPLVVTSRRDPRTLRFVRRPDLAELALQGPATPDHVLRTRRLPLLGRDVAAYADAYRRYFEEHAPTAREPKTMLDPAPRIVLDGELGLLAAGRTASEAAIAAELYQHTMDVIERADRLGGYRALSAEELFEFEYWDLEQAKLRRAGEPPPFAGEIALVTGAASGIGKACVEALLARGAAVVGLDVEPRIEELFQPPAVLGLRCDVTAEEQVAAALEAGVAAFGGLDLLILNAGIFPDSREIAGLALEEWRRVMAVNLDANLILMRRCHPLLRLAPRGGRVAVIGSKNVPAPGPGAAAYSASKAALQQLARVAALEWGRDGIRVNIVHPNAVFDTALWTKERLAARAAAYHLDVEAYRKANVLGLEVRSRDVAEAAVELCGPRFSRTTGAQVPVDGGNDRVI